MSSAGASVTAVWTRIQAAPTNLRSPLRTPVLSTVDAHGDPTSRLVVLRRVSSDQRTLTVYTDTASRKCAELALLSRAAFCFWDPKAKLQIRLNVDVRRDDGPETQRIWQSMSERSSASYRVTPPPGTPIDAAGAFTFGEEGRFTRLVCTAKRMDVLWLSRPKHRRLTATWTESGWHSEWVVP